MIEKLLCNRNKTLLDALQKININLKGIVFIVDEDKRLCGILTDGDIRRLLLRGCNLQQVIDTELKKDFVYAKKSEHYDDLIKKINYRIHIIPIVDDEFKVVDYFEYRSDAHIPVALPNLNGNELKYLTEAFLSTWISSRGKYIERFEKGFSDYCGCRYGVTVSNGTCALHLALISLGIGEGDEVIIPDLTFAATINAVLHSNATPVIVDIEHDSWCICPEEIEKAITPRTKAIIPVHLYGQPCDMERIMVIAKRHNLFVIEDCAEAHGAEFGGKKVGSFGDIGCFSFFGNKVITTGEGGMCVTDSERLNNKMRIIKNHGMSKTKKYWHETLGYNYRMTNLQAAIGVAQLERIDEKIKERKRIEDEYKENLSNIACIEFQRNDLLKRKKITWLVTALITNNKRDIYITKLKKKGIDARTFFYPLSKMGIYKKYLFSNKVTVEISRKGIIFPTANNIDEKTFGKFREIFKLTK